MDVDIHRRFEELVHEIDSSVDPWVIENLLAGSTPYSFHEWKNERQTATPLRISYRFDLSLEVGILFASH